MDKNGMKKFYIFLLLVISLLLFIPGVCVFADDASYTIVENEDITNLLNGLESPVEDLNTQEVTNRVNSGIDRQGMDVMQTNIVKFRDVFLTFMGPIVGFLIFIMVLWTGFFAIAKSGNSKERVLVAEKLKHIIIGALIFGTIVLIFSLIVRFQFESIQSSMEVETQLEEIVNPEPIGQNWIVNIIESIFKWIARSIESILYSLARFLGGTWWLGDRTAQEDTSDPFNLGQLIFFEHFGNTIPDINSKAAGESIFTAPFGEKEYARYLWAYLLLSFVAIPLMLIALVKFAIEFIVFSGNYEKLAETKQGALRICMGILLIALGPHLFKIILMICNMMVFFIPVDISKNFWNADGFSIEHANGLLSVITCLWWIFIKFKIVLVFLVRKIMLTVMFIAIPVVTGIWTISSKFRAMQLWIGETLTNAVTQFCYALVFFLGTAILGNGNTNPFFTLIWFSMMIELADFFKESFQGLFQKWGGIDETRVATGMAGMAGKWALSANASVQSKLFDGERVHPVPRLFGNAMALGKFAMTGNAEEYMSKGAAGKKYYANLGKVGSEDIHTAHYLMGTEEYKEAAQSEKGRVLLDQYKKLGELKRQKAKPSIIKDKENQINAWRIQQNDAGLDFIANIKGIETSGIEKLKLKGVGYPYYKAETKRHLFSSVGKGMEDRMEEKMVNLATDPHYIKDPSKIYDLFAKTVPMSPNRISEENSTVFEGQYAKQDGKIVAGTGAFTPPEVAYQNMRNPLNSQRVANFEIGEANFIGANFKTPEEMQNMMMNVSASVQSMMAMMENQKGTLAAPNLSLTEKSEVLRSGYTDLNRHRELLYELISNSQLTGEGVVKANDQISGFSEQLSRNNEDLVKQMGVGMPKNIRPTQIR